MVQTRPLQEAVLRLADDTDKQSCGHDLLHRRLPRLRGLDRSVLPVQGPPGAGKTYAGAQMIRPLVRDGRRGCGRFDDAGLWYVPVPHTGNQNASDEEVEVVVAIVAELLRPGATWVNGSGETQPLTPTDLRIVAPYNAHVNRLRERLDAGGVPVGTVDRFQGQEGPVVIYSMATSSPADAPRGMEFLYSLNRLNVASSRARGAVVVVASPAVCEPECRTPRQMQLASALCRYHELAIEITLPAAGSGV